MDMLINEWGDQQKASDDQKRAANEQRALQAELESIAEPPTTVALHPQVLARYEQQLGQMQAALSAGVSAGDGEGIEIIRSLVESVTVYRDKTRSDGISIVITGRLNDLLGKAAYPNGVCFGMVAGEGL